MWRFARRQRRAVITIAPDARRIDSSEVLNCSPRSRALRHINAGTASRVFRVFQSVRTRK